MKHRQLSQKGNKMIKFCNLQALLPNEGNTVHNDDGKSGKKTVTKKSNRQSKITVPLQFRFFISDPLILVTNKQDAIM